MTTNNILDVEFLRLLAEEGQVGLTEGWDLAPEELKIELTGIADKALEVMAIASQEAEKTAADFKNIPTENMSLKVKRGRKPKPLALLAPLPTELTRCSPFFPYSPKDKKNKKKVFAEDFVLATHSWGSVTYRGPRLSTSHEDLLLVTLAAVSDLNKRRDVVLADGRSTYSYCGPLREILRAKGNSHPNSEDYDNAFDLYRDMAGAVLSIVDSKGRLKMFSSMIVGGARMRDNQFYVEVNPVFAESMMQKRVTWYDVQLRMRIKSSYGKSIYRFISGHRAGWSGQLSLLSKTINLPVEWTNSDARERLNPALKELVSLHILGKDSFIAGTKVVLVKGKALK